MPYLGPGNWHTQPCRAGDQAGTWENWKAGAHPGSLQVCIAEAVTRGPWLLPNAARLTVALQEPQVRAEKEQLRALPHRTEPSPFPTPTAPLCRPGDGPGPQWPLGHTPMLCGTNLGSLSRTSIFYYSGKTCQMSTRPNKPEAFLTPGPPHHLIQDPHTIRDCACRRILIKTSNSQGLAGQAAWPCRVSAIPGLGGQEALLGTSAPKTNTEQQAGFVFSL